MSVRTAIWGTRSVVSPAKKSGDGHRMAEESVFDFENGKHVFPQWGIEDQPVDQTVEIRSERRTGDKGETEPRYCFSRRDKNGPNPVSRPFPLVLEQWYKADSVPQLRKGSVPLHRGKGPTGDHEPLVRRKYERIVPFFQKGPLKLIDSRDHSPCKTSVDRIDGGEIAAMLGQADWNDCERRDPGIPGGKVLDGSLKDIAIVDPRGDNDLGVQPDSP